MSGEPGRVYSGGQVKIVVDFVDDDGNPVDPATITYRLMSPSRVKSSYVYGVNDEVTNPQIGRYKFAVPSELLIEGGRWFFRLETTGTIYAREGNFIVQATPFNDSCLNTGYQL